MIKKGKMEGILSPQDLHRKRLQVTQKYEESRNTKILIMRQEFAKDNDIALIEKDENMMLDYQEQIMQINYDIAWMIFDEVNKENDTLSLIDLSCLSVFDACAITKQKIFDLAMFIREKQQENQAKKIERILTVVCANNHIVKRVADTSLGLKSKTYSENEVLKMIQQELQMDNFYFEKTLTILVRVNTYTLEIPVL